ncbi:MAG: ATPase [Deltaproteobacteria bacterium]|nr:ATPase [Deltaproteobacteria bacterium]
MPPQKPLDPAAPTTILCVASYFKGNDFIDQCKREGCKVFLLTLESLLGKPWVRESIDEVFALPQGTPMTDRRQLINAVAYLMRNHDIQRVAPLDDYDVEIVAHLREHLRIPGMGETTARYFRDKLAMRTRAKDRGIPVPDFVPILHHPRISDYLDRVPAPWLLKPRGEASASGIQKLHTKEEAWAAINALGDEQSYYLLERFTPGDIFHVDAITSDREVVFAECHQYRRPLLQIAQGGGIFATRTVARGSTLERQLLEMHKRVIRELGIVRGVTHTEFIRGQDGTIYFLETAARVGGVHISDLVEATTGINLWREWAKIEITQGEKPYRVPSKRADYGGLIVTLAKQESPDTSAYTDPEIVWRMQDNAHHVGLAVRSPSAERVDELLDQYERRFAEDFAAVLPQARTPTA